MVGGPQPPPRDPVYDGVGPRTSADGSSKLRYHFKKSTGRYLPKQAILIFDNLFAVLWIRIRIDFGGLVPDPGGQEWRRKIEKNEKFTF
jgi:hypothetical protein